MLVTVSQTLPVCSTVITMLNTLLFIDVHHKLTCVDY